MTRGLHDVSDLAGRIGALVAAGLLAAPAAAQVAAVPNLPQIESAEAALARDAAQYAIRYGVAQGEAERALRLQQASVPASDALAREFADRVVAITFDRRPEIRLTVRLTGDVPVPSRTLMLDGDALPVIFETGLPVTQSAIIAAITRYQAEIRASLTHPPAIGLDARTGEMLVLVGSADAAALGRAALAQRFANLTGVPVRVEVTGEGVNMAVAGGSRVVGTLASDGRRGVCTAGFAVSDGARTAVATAAHCPDELSLVGADGQTTAMPFVAQAGWGYQDVQINAADTPLAPLFFADTAKTLARPVERAQSRASTRVGDFVCHRGERTGYSCAEVVMTDFAPAGDLCGGACLPTWVAVEGPTCGSGDSGSPVFSLTTALGIVKGGTYRPDRSCVMYYYMSVDYLPKGWSLLQGSAWNGAPAAQPNP